MHTAARSSPARVISTRPARKHMVLAPVSAVRQQLGQLCKSAHGGGTGRHATVDSLCAGRVHTAGAAADTISAHAPLATPLASNRAASRIACVSGEGSDGGTAGGTGGKLAAGEKRFQEVAAAVAGYMQANGKWPAQGTQLAGIDAGHWLLQLRSAVQASTAAPARVDMLVDLASILSAEVPRHTWTMGTLDSTAAPSAATDQQFNAGVGQVALYKLLMGDLPREEECLIGKPVGAWFCALRADLRLEDLSDSRLTAVNSAFQAVLGQDRFPDVEAPALIKAWAGIGAYNDLRWSRSLQAVCAFVRETGRLPSKTAEDDHERQLGYWVCNTRTNLSKGTAYLSFAREERLDMTLGRKVWGPLRENGPLPCHVADLRHLVMCAAIGLIPPSVVLGLTAKSWASDLASYCDGSGTGSRGIRITGRTLPASVGAHNLKRARTWLGAAYALDAYVIEHERLPNREIPAMRVPRVNRVCGEGEEPVASCQVQNAAVHAGGSEASIASKLIAAAAAVPYCSGHAEAADKVQNEIDLATWLMTTRKDAANGNLGADKVVVLDALVGHMGEWRVSVPVRASSGAFVWEQTLGHVVSLLHTKGHLPKGMEFLEGSDSLDGQGHPVGKWLANQRARARDGKLADSQREELDDKLPGWHLGGRTVC